MSGLIHCLIHKMSTRPLANRAPFEAADAEWAADQLAVPRTSRLTPA